MLYKPCLKSALIVAISLSVSATFAMGVRGHGKLCPYYKKSPYECSIPSQDSNVSSSEKPASGQDK